MVQKFDRIKDSVPVLIDRFGQNENSIKDHHVIKLDTVVGAVQIKLFAIDVAEFD